MAINAITVADASGQCYAGKGLLHSILIGGTDGSNDVTLTLYDNTVASGKVLVPTHTVDASALGLNGVSLSVGKNFDTGVYVEITTSGTVDVTCDIEARA